MNIDLSSVYEYEFQNDEGQISIQPFSWCFAISYPPTLIDDHINFQISSNSAGRVFPKCLKIFPILQSLDKKKKVYHSKSARRPQVNMSSTSAKFQKRTQVLIVLFNVKVRICQILDREHRQFSTFANLRYLVSVSVTYCVKNNTPAKLSGCAGKKIIQNATFQRSYSFGKLLENSRIKIS